MKRNCRGRRVPRNFIYRCVLLQSLGTLIATTTLVPARHRATPASFYGHLKSLILETANFSATPRVYAYTRTRQVRPSRDSARNILRRCRRTGFNRIGLIQCGVSDWRARGRPYLSISRGIESLCCSTSTRFDSIRFSDVGSVGARPRLSGAARQMMRKSRVFPRIMSPHPPPSSLSPPIVSVTLLDTRINARFSIHAIYFVPIH